MIWRYQPEVEGGPMRTEPLPYHPTSIAPRYPQNMPQMQQIQQGQMSLNQHQGYQSPMLGQMNQQQMPPMMSQQMLPPMSAGQSPYQTQGAQFNPLNSILSHLGLDNNYGINNFLRMLMNHQQGGGQQMNNQRGFM